MCQLAGRDSGHRERYYVELLKGNFAVLSATVQHVGKPKKTKDSMLMKTNVCCLATALLLFGALIAASGCGARDTRPFRDDSQDPSRYSERIKNIVLEALQALPGDPEPDDIAAGLVSELSQYSENPVGEFEDTYAQLLTGAKQLQEHFRGGGNVRGVEPVIAEMTALAESLLGELWD